MAIVRPLLYRQRTHQTTSSRPLFRRPNLHMYCHRKMTIIVMGTLEERKRLNQASLNIIHQDPRRLARRESPIIRTRVNRPRRLRQMDESQCQRCEKHAGRTTHHRIQPRGGRRKWCPSRIQSPSHHLHNTYPANRRLPKPCDRRFHRTTSAFSLVPRHSKTEIMKLSPNLILSTPCPHRPHARAAARIMIPSDPPPSNLAQCRLSSHSIRQ